MKIYALLAIIIIQITISTENYLRRKPKYRPTYYEIRVPSCAENEEYLKCGDEYGRHCRDILKPLVYKNSIANDNECNDGCFCIQEFYRKDANGLCVNKDGCYVDKYNRGLSYYTGKQRFRRSNSFAFDSDYQRENYDNEEENGEDNGEDYPDTYRRSRNSVYEERKRRLKRQMYLNEEKRRQYLLSQIRDYYEIGKKKMKKKKKYKIPNDNKPLQQSQDSNSKSRFHRYQSDNRDRKTNYRSSRRCGRQNEVFQRCGSDCGKTCNKIRQNQYCDSNVVCRSGCFCVIGYVRDDYGECITRDKCRTDYSKCGKNKKHLKCGNDCNMLCKDILSPGHRECDQKKCSEGCFCINGMFMNGKNQCVPPKQCA